jgi:hypothetical protein
MMRSILGVLRRWVTQEVALANAAQASVRLQHQRRQLADVDAFIAAHHHPSQQNIDGELTTHAAHSQPPPAGGQ